MITLITDNNYNATERDLAKKHVSYSELLNRDGKWKKPERSKEWVLLQKKRYRNRFIGEKGIAIGDSNNESINFKAADKKVMLFISNVHTDTTENDYQLHSQKNRRKCISY